MSEQTTYEEIEQIKQLTKMLMLVLKNYECSLPVQIMALNSLIVNMVWNIEDEEEKKIAIDSFVKGTLIMQGSTPESVGLLETPVY